jgi:mannose-6-phosphate isomerase-like protein (cupin superfamily)
MIEILGTIPVLPPMTAFSELFLDAPRATVFVTPHSGQFAFLARAKDSTIPLGNHFHMGSVAEKNPELIHVVAGSWKIRAQAVNEAGQLIGDLAEYSVHAGQTVVVPPLIWHAFYAQTTDAALIELYADKEDYTRDVHRVLEATGS